METSKERKALIAAFACIYMERWRVGWATNTFGGEEKLFCIVFIVSDHGFHFKTDIKETVSTATAFIVLSLMFCY